MFQRDNREESTNTDFNDDLALDGQELDTGCSVFGVGVSSCEGYIGGAHASVYASVEAFYPQCEFIRLVSAIFLR